MPTQKWRKLVEQEIFAEAAEKVRVFGIELLDIRFKRINYNEACGRKIYDPHDQRAPADREKASCRKATVRRRRSAVIACAT